MKTKLVIVPTTAQSMMCGVLMIEKRAGECTIVYLDGMRETCLIGKMSPLTDWDNIFSIVGNVQALRDGK